VDKAAHGVALCADGQLKHVDNTRTCPRTNHGRRESQLGRDAVEMESGQSKTTEERRTTPGRCPVPPDSVDDQLGSTQKDDEDFDGSNERPATTQRPPRPRHATGSPQMSYQAICQPCRRPADGSRAVFGPVQSSQNLHQIQIL